MSVLSEPRTTYNTGSDTRPSNIDLLEQRTQQRIYWLYRRAPPFQYKTATAVTTANRMLNKLK
jgi:hypothetical protein